MSLCQAVTTSQQDFALFTPSWQAGVLGSQYTQKPLKNIDTESVNIVRTCEKLSSALNENLKYIQNTSHSMDDNEKQCAIRKSNISFRDFSNIWFGTLKIYQQQVNTLFRLSQDLFSRSGNNKVKPLAARKRNSSLTSQKLVKKRCLSINESYKESYGTKNYTKLLDDLEELTREESLPMSLTEHFKNIPALITKYQINEITLREIIHHPDELEEDSGFGEATSEDIAKFFNFDGDKDVYNKKSTVKHRLANEEDLPIKKRCLNKDFSEPNNNEYISIINDTLKIKTLKRSNSESNFLYENNKSINTINCLTDNVQCNYIFDADKIKKENVADGENTVNIFTKKKRTLIIDDCIKIDTSDVIKAMKTSEVLTKRTRKNISKLFKKTRKMTAFELLTKFNRRSKLTLSLKQKYVLSRAQFERDYLNLLREIFNPYYKEDLASEIYPKWISFGNARIERNKKSLSHKSIVIQPESGVYNFNEVLISNLASDDSYDKIPAICSIKKVHLTSTRKYDKWRPYDVMQKLLNLWRSNKTNQISAYTLFKLAGNQIDRSLGFNSLLHLSKKRFVNLTKFPGSIELQNISVGKNCVNNIT